MAKRIVQHLPENTHKKNRKSKETAGSIADAGHRSQSPMWSRILFAAPASLIKVMIRGRLCRLVDWHDRT
jgi:hypothetical protein